MGGSVRTSPVWAQLTDPPVPTHGAGPGTLSGRPLEIPVINGLCQCRRTNTASEAVIVPSENEPPSSGIQLQIF